MRPVEQSRDADAAGPRGSPAIVLVHSLGMTRRLWEAQLNDGVLTQGYRVIAPDLPRHGTLAGLPFRMETAIQRLAALIDREGAGRAIVVGLSLGGYVSMRLASLHPHRVAGLVLASCTADPRGMPALGFRILGWAIRVGGDQWYAALNAWLFRRTLPAAVAEAQIRAGLYFAGLPEVADELLGKDARAWLASYPGPVLLVNGAHDRWFRRHEKAFLAECRAGQCEVLPRAAHLANLDQPDAFAQTIVRFARSIGWTRR
jgi:pimeloyl-ACP methyl ester carboxylesterase